MISAWEFVSHQINKSLCTLSFKCSLTNSKQAVTSVLPTVASVSLLCWSKGLICRDQLRSRPAGYLISAENVSVLCVSWNEACFVLFIPINKLYLHMQCYECVLHLKPLWWCLHENLFIINWRFVKPGRSKCNLFRVVSAPVDCLVVFSLLLLNNLINKINLWSCICQQRVQAEKLWLEMCWINFKQPHQALHAWVKNSFRELLVWCLLKMKTWHSEANLWFDLRAQKNVWAGCTSRI